MNCASAEGQLTVSRFDLRECTHDIADRNEDDQSEGVQVATLREEGSVGKRAGVSARFGDEGERARLTKECRWGYRGC